MGMIEISEAKDIEPEEKNIESRTLKDTFV